MMRAKKLMLRSMVLIALIHPLLSYAISLKKPLSLSEAEHLAISASPELRRFQANADALEEQSVADGQLSDPQLVAGVANLPTNSFSFTQDDMTMIQAGLQQSFPAGHSLAVKSKKTKALAKAQRQKVQEQAAMLLRNVREIWLDLYYWNQAALVVNKNRSLYRQLLKATESQYSSGQKTQSDVLQLQVELSRLNDQAIQIEQQISLLKTQLARWIGLNEAHRPLLTNLPKWPAPLPLNTLQSRLLQHPVLRVDTANIEAAHHDVAYAKEQYKPGWMLGVGYAVRQGTMSNGQPRSNFVGGQVTVDLPFFTKNRQDKQSRASAYQLAATELERDIHYKDLLQELTDQYITWKSLTARESLYRQHVYPEAQQNAKAALLGYQSTTTDLTTVLRAYSNELTIQLENIQIQVERTKARVALLYFEGATQ